MLAVTVTLHSRKTEIVMLFIVLFQKRRRMHHCGFVVADATGGSIYIVLTWMNLLINLYVKNALKVFVFRILT